MIEIKAYAKINWDLRILGKRPDGFHALDTVMVNVSLHDTLTFSESDTFELTCSDPTLPTDERNLVYKAAALLAKASGHRLAARIHVEKQIPAGGGMGGGSSDAAATLRGLSKLWQLHSCTAELHNLAAELGSDVAFFLYGGWCRCLGRGEIVEPMEGSELWPAVHLLLILPCLHVATPAVYKALAAPRWDGKSFDRTLTDAKSGVESAVKAAQSGTHTLGLRNDLMQAARAVEPGLVGVQRGLQMEFPGRWLMSGSGAVHFVVPGRGDEGASLRARLNEGTGPGIRVLTATTFSPLI